jgi:hypothetical protein
LFRTPARSYFRVSLPTAGKTVEKLDLLADKPFKTIAPINCLEEAAKTPATHTLV